MGKIINLENYKESKKIQLTLKQAELIVDFINSSLELDKVNKEDEELIERAYKIVNNL